MAQSINDCTRRDFLKVGTASLGAVSLGLPFLNAESARGEINCIMLMLVGGPSQLETFDPKPDAPSRVRGPFSAIRTRVPGVLVSEHLPRLAERLDRVTLIRSMHHDTAPIHETGFQLMQTGRLFRGGPEQPHLGAVMAQRFGPRRAGVAPFALVPGPIGHTGVSVSRGQGAGALGDCHGPVPINQLVKTESASLRDRYGCHHFGEHCLIARQLIEQGTRMVTVNMFDSVFDRITWDAHADGGSLPATLNDYQRSLCPMFDQAFTALLDDLRERGLLDSTLVVAMGEMGRTPHLNPNGGRDHWAGVWSIVMAGAGVEGGRVIGSSDRFGAEPIDQPITPTELVESIRQRLGIPA